MYSYEQAGQAHGAKALWVHGLSSAVEGRLPPPIERVVERI